MLQEISNPFGILDIRFATRNVPHVAGIDNNGRQGGNNQWFLKDQAFGMGDVVGAWFDMIRSENDR